MWFPNLPPKVDLPLPVWVKYKGPLLARWYDYMLDKAAVGYVALAGRPCVYLWGLDRTNVHNQQCTTLRAAKRKVEAAFREHYSWRFPVSRGY